MIKRREPNAHMAAKRDNSVSSADRAQALGTALMAIHRDPSDNETLGTRCYTLLSRPDAHRRQRAGRSKQRSTGHVQITA